MKSAVVAVLQKENRDNGSGTMSGKRVAAVGRGIPGGRATAINTVAFAERAWKGCGQAAWS